LSFDFLLSQELEKRSLNRIQRDPLKYPLDRQRKNWFTYPNNVRSVPLAVIGLSYPVVSGFLNLGRG
jgi:hypothetical protein